MHKCGIGLLGVLIVALLVLSACTGGANDTQQASPTEQGVGLGQMNETTPTREAEPLFPPQEEIAPGEAGGVKPSGEESANTPVLASILLEYEVTAQNGQIGDVQGIILDTLVGRSPYLVIQVIGPSPSRQILLPWSTFQVVNLPPQEEMEGVEPAQQVWLNVDPSLLQDAPEFDPSLIIEGQSLPKNWDANVLAYWEPVVGEASLPVTGGEENENDDSLLYLESNLFGDIDFHIKSGEGGDAGEIEDFIFAADGTILFAVLEPDDEQEVGNGWIPIPWQAIAWIPEEGTFLLTLPVKSLEDAPRIDSASAPDMSVPGWEEPWRKYWEVGQVQAGVPEVTPTGGATTLIVLGSTLASQPVKDVSNRPIGEVVDWMVDESGLSTFALLSFNDRYFPVPWTTLEWQADQDHILFNQNPDILEDAPSYNAAEGVDRDADWYRRAVEYWSSSVEVVTATPTTDSAAPHISRMQAILEQPVPDAQGNDIGRLKDVVVAASGQAQYLILQVGDQYIPVPWINFELNTEYGSLRYIDDVERLQDAPGFESLAGFDLTLPEWDQKIRQHWGMY